MALAFISGARRGTSQQLSYPISGTKLVHSSNDDDSGSLVRINPWLSACDLAQPNTAPDLQGSCSTGTFSQSRVDEGPGPPQYDTITTCELFNRSNNNTKNSNNNNDSYININNNKKQTLNTMENDHNTTKHQQCLDYLGGKRKHSSTVICNNTRNQIGNILTGLRLRHCYERSAISALHGDALNIVQNGGNECIRTLNDLIDTDTLANRITCEFNEIIIRYDCRQPYSLIHNCKDCKEAYRRWVCSTLIPYFVEPDDIRLQNHSNLKILSNSTITNRTKSIDNNINDKINPNSNDRKPSSLIQYFENYSSFSRVLRRSRRKIVKDRYRIRPCLNVCQTVEQKCPYFLPADRAPALPTQYAGEPTFLCLDPHIEETGEQIEKSNNGPPNCCYNYCDNGICSDCQSMIDLKIDIANKPDSFNEYLGSNVKAIIAVATSQCQNLPTTNTTPSQNPCIIPFYASSSSSITKLINFNIFNYKYNNLTMITLWSIILFYLAAWTKIISHQLAQS